tara:strand:+ start:2814 stop:4034 length:1221 start_codon:yes stop_codon:yes gene_type:complete
MKYPIQNILALFLVIPTYVTFFIGKEPLMQGLAFSLYFVPLIVTLIKNKTLHLPRLFLFIWGVFLIAWIFPSIINSQSGRLESELISLPVLFFHAMMLTIVILILYDYLSRVADRKLGNLLQLIFWVMLPMMLLMSMKIGYLSFYHPNHFQLGFRPFPFGIHPNVAAEIILVFLLTATQLTNRFWQWTVYVISITFLYILSSRGALIASFLGLFIIYGLPWLKAQLSIKRLVVTTAILGFALMLYHQEIFSLIKSVLILDTRTHDIAGRGGMWLLGLESIQAKPWLGTGFFVTPHGFSTPEFSNGSLPIDHPSLIIHNAFIRIFSENGIILFLMAMAFLVLTGLSLLREKNYQLLGIFCAILFFLFFSTRHLTLNLMNIILYFIVIRSLLYQRQSITGWKLFAVFK